MEGPLLSKSEHIKIDGDSSSNGEHVVNVIVDDVSSPTPPEAEGLQLCNLCTRKNVWNFIEFVLNVVQIVAAIEVLNRAKDENLHILLFIWIIGYTCGCIATLTTICWRFWQYSRFAYPETVVDEVMDFLREMLEYFFVGWIVVLSWVYSCSSASLNEHTQHFWLCMAFVAFSCIRYVPLHPKFAAFGFIFAVIIWIDAIYTELSPTLKFLGGFVVFILIIIAHTWN